MVGVKVAADSASDGRQLSWMRHTATSTSLLRTGLLSSMSIWGQFSTDWSPLAFWLYSSEQYPVHRCCICRPSVRHFPERSWVIAAFPEVVWTLKWYGHWSGMDAEVVWTCLRSLWTEVVWTCLPFIRSGQNHLARHSERMKKTRQTEKEVGRQYQGMDRPGVRQVPESSGELGKNGGKWLWNHLWYPNDPRG